MIVLTVLIIVIIFITVLLLCPVRIEASYRDKLFLNIRYLFITYQVVPAKKPKVKKDKKKEKKESAKKKLSKKEKKPSFLKKIIKKEGISGFFEIVQDVTKFSIRELKSFFKHIIIQELHIKLDVAGSDAAATAIQYGNYCAVLFPAVALVSSNSNFKYSQLVIKPNFDQEVKKSQLTAKVRFKLVPLWPFKLALSFIIKGISVFFKIIK